MFVNVNVYVQLPNLELQRNQINELKLKTLTHIIIFHIITNSIISWGFKIY